ncbi:hypothetical protein [Pedomonas sp. V897]|uniref:hypothetical protein n=1 Tax=Pedomonas sp. V897 TaxID=3446482 RepID=UPI003EE2152F
MSTSPHLTLTKDRLDRFVKGQRVYYVRPLPAAPHRVEFVKCTVTWTRGPKMTLAASQMGQTIYRRNLVNSPVQPDGAQIWCGLTESEARERAYRLGAGAIAKRIERLSRRVHEQEAAAGTYALALDRQSLERMKHVKPHLEPFGMWIDELPAAPEATDPGG